MEYGPHTSMWRKEFRSYGKMEQRRRRRSCCSTICLKLFEDRSFDENATASLLLPGEIGIHTWSWVFAVGNGRGSHGGAGSHTASVVKIEFMG
jgi:hypothetical protein